MPNPFTFHNNPATPKEHQANANYWTYEKLAAIELLQEYDNKGIAAPCKVIANVHTAKWVEKEYIRIAQSSRKVTV